MRQLYIFFFLAVSITTQTVYSSHLKGGGFQLTHISGNQYKIELHLYFDEHNATPGVIDAYQNQDMKVIIFDSGTNEKMDSVNLIQYYNERLPYGDTCLLEDLATRLLKFSATIYLLPSKYNNTAGYYMAFEDCCRSSVIKNIQNPFNVGITYYLEFPSLLKNGATFINSSPRLPEIYDSYACLNNDYIVPFGNIDLDGDSLVYRLIDPLAGNMTNGGSYIVSPAPYPKVSWKTGYSLSNVINGTVPLVVSQQSGKLTLNASETGVFTFAVACEEYRNDEKIGVSYREYNIYVQDCDNLNCMVLGVQNKEEEKGFSLSPNPFENVIDLHLNFAFDEILIVDAVGGVRKQIFNTDPELYELQVQVQDFKSGMYFCVVKSKGKIFQKKIVKL